MGVLPELEAAGFPKKYGAQFHLGNGRKIMRFIFAEGRMTRETQAFQVERAKFDQILLKHAARSGAETREEWTVSRFQVEKDSAWVEASGGGVTERFTAPFIIDASGRANLTGNQEGLRVVHPRLKKLAVFSHFSGVWRQSGPRYDDIVVVRLHNKWFWLIPLAADRVSVGCVMDQAEFQEKKASPAEVFESIWRSSPEMVKRMGQSQPLAPIQTTADFSYYNRRLAGPRLVRVGDAAGFMDPIFSAGVYLAMYSGRLAARNILESLAAGDNGAVRFKKYEKRIWSSMRFYWRMVELFYTTPFVEVLMQPREKFLIQSAVNAALAGEVENPWHLRWRLGLFFGIVRLQRWIPILPRLNVG
jgi:FADH2-dependent halogenase